MRSLSFDQFEFDCPDSEENLTIAISSRRQHRDFADFIAEFKASEGTESASAGFAGHEMVKDHVRRFAALELPPWETCRVIVVINEWNHVELAIDAGNWLIWYQWHTTA